MYMWKQLQRRYSVVKTMNPSPASGKLMLIPTPIGNMSDISPNILKALFTADLIGCEDRRVAGQLYTLIKNKQIIQETIDRFGTFGISNLIEIDPQNPYKNQQVQHLFYNYSNMKDKQRLKFLRKMPYEQQNAFKLQYLKYRALKILNKQNQFILKKDNDKLDELYGIQTSDLHHIENQIMNCRQKKNRGLLISLNTYSETKMYDMVRSLLQSKQVAIVSDAGMPCISDPGWRMVSKIRETMPQVPVQVIGGPSSVGIMITLAAVSSKGTNALSGRFEGFSSLAAAGLRQQTVQAQTLRDNEFSINFINAHKLKRKIFQLQKIYGTNHNILLANQLTKRYERKYSGPIYQLIQNIANDQKFNPIGQVSYLLYPKSKKQLSYSFQKQQLEQNFNSDKIRQTIRVSVYDFLTSLENCSNLKNSDKIELICSIFHMKTNMARKIVYQQLALKKNVEQNVFNNMLITQNPNNKKPQQILTFQQQYPLYSQVKHPVKKTSYLILGRRNRQKKVSIESINENNND